MSTATATRSVGVNRRTIEELAALPDCRLAECDVAELNLLCAEGLPGAEDLDIGASLQRLDEWAAVVAYGTRRLLPDFHASPDLYENDEAYFRMLVFVTVLQRNLGVHYDAQLISEPGDPFCKQIRDSKPLFLHGVLAERAGTCVSLPVLYVAVGRRLGYPLFLVRAKGHLFARWEHHSTGQRFNIEATSQGLNVRPDDHYLQWPFPLTEADLRSEMYLRSFTPRQELGVFVAERGYCLSDNGLYRQAADAFQLATDLEPDNDVFSFFFQLALRREAEQVPRADLTALRHWHPVANSVVDLLPMEHVVAGKQKQCYP